MNGLIGNHIKVLLKDKECTVAGILLETNDRYDYIQSGQSVCIVPKVNVLYYITDRIQPETRVLKPQTTATRSVGVFVDDKIIAELQAPSELPVEELMTLVYTTESVQQALEGKTQKTFECFADSVYITTDHERAPKQLAFTMGERNTTNSYLSPTEMALRLESAARTHK